MKRISIALATVALGVSGTALAQNIFGDPNSGTVTLSANFEDDPRTVSVTSGGDIDASEAIDGCVGYISEDPDVRLSFTADESPNAFPLYISATSDEDTVLVINAPDGNWYCNDDGSEGQNPSVVFGPAQSGDYEIWIGSYEQGQYHDAQLNISELGGQ
ncbi:hypothetical protein NAP1_05345 [Erythrobacter sp. NAP1]|uniref:hypothetical protein n=1 Tax=Erythrobacter sp. NAP1 TaxID=237727 RepID=UPI0000686D41|nr:hypothetical protein [Erythrobacter sp. NAP1]EAQ30175.1 hypothetical protein NAP1_05345 [Erythrobacter sp. NAP1]